MWASMLDAYADDDISISADSVDLGQCIVAVSHAREYACQGLDAIDSGVRAVTQLNNGVFVSDADD